MRIPTVFFHSNPVLLARSKADAKKSFPSRPISPVREMRDFSPWDVKAITHCIFLTQYVLSSHHPASNQCPNTRLSGRSKSKGCPCYSDFIIRCTTLSPLHPFTALSCSACSVSSAERAENAREESTCVRAASRHSMTPLICLLASDVQM